MEGMGPVSSSQAPPHGEGADNPAAAMPPPLTEDDIIRIEFYKTYDVMTGVRIAATLGGFFSMMILLVLYKSYCKPGKSLSEEQLNRAVSAAVEEEDRALAAALEATSFYSSLGKSGGQSLGGTSQPRVSSSAGTVIRFNGEDEMDEQEEGAACAMGCATDENDLPHDQAPEYYSTCSYLNVPVDRRHSSVTCSSGDTSYLEHRGSAFEMGLPPPPCCSSDKRKVPPNEDQWDFYYPVDIQVIQPTPQLTPSGSEQTIYEEPGKLGVRGLKVPSLHDKMQRLAVHQSEIGLAPLASISSLGSFSSQSSPWLSAARKERKEIKDEIEEDSLGSDSVFGDDVDTEDEVEEFETDSELEDGFDDDYSFCEASCRPVSRCERQPRFASFDSCDMSIVEDGGEDRTTIQRGPSPRNIRKQISMQDGVKVKKRLTKTYSEPRHTKQLPPWIERGRSGYVPRRQLSAPTDKTKETVVAVVSEESPRQPLPLPSDTSIDDCNSQGTLKDSSSGGKRARFSKQKTIHDETSSCLLATPSFSVSRSCERLAESPTPDDSPTTVVNMPLSPSSSQETIC